MAGNETVKGLDREAKITNQIFQLFPLWLIRIKNEGQEEVYLQPAAALSVSELKRVTIPASDLESYDPAMDPDAVEATVPYKTMLGWLLEEQGVKKVNINESSLVHYPIYIFKYVHKGRQYTAMVDAAAGRVFANIFPSKWEAPYMAIGATTFVVYLLAALIPAVGYLIGGGEGMVVGIFIYIIAAIVLAIPLFVVASIISAKV